MAGPRIAWMAALVGPMLAGAALAEERSFTCPTEGFTVYRDPGLTGDLAVLIRDGDAPTVELHGPWGDIALPARQVTIGDPTVFAEAIGEVPLPMPDRGAVDACIAEAERKDPGIMRGRRDADVLKACKDAAPLTAEPVAARLSFSIIVFEPPEAQAIIKRRYADEDEDDAGRLHGVDSMVVCTSTPP